MVLAMMDVIFVDFSQQIALPDATKIHTIAHNGEQNLLVCRTRQLLLMFLQGTGL